MFLLVDRKIKLYATSLVMVCALATSATQAIAKEQQLPSNLVTAAEEQKLPGAAMANPLLNGASGGARQEDNVNGSSGGNAEPTDDEDSTKTTKRGNVLTSNYNQPPQPAGPSQGIGGWLWYQFTYVFNSIYTYLLNSVAVVVQNMLDAIAYNPNISARAPVSLADQVIPWFGKMRMIAFEVSLLLFLGCIWKYWTDSAYRGNSSIMGSVGRLIAAIGLIIMWPNLSYFIVELANEMISVINFDQQRADIASIIQQLIQLAFASSFIRAIIGTGIGPFIQTLLYTWVIGQVLYILILKAIQNALIVAQYVFAPIFIVCFASPDTEKYAVTFFYSVVEVNLWNFFWIGLAQVLVMICKASFDPFGQLLMVIGILHVMMNVPEFMKHAAISPVSHLMSLGGLQNMWKRAQQKAKEANGADGSLLNQGWNRFKQFAGLGQYGGGEFASATGATGATAAAAAAAGRRGQGEGGPNQTVPPSKGTKDDDSSPQSMSEREQQQRVNDLKNMIAKLPVPPEAKKKINDALDEAVASGAALTNALKTAQAAFPNKEDADAVKQALNGTADSATAQRANDLVNGLDDNHPSKQTLKQGLADAANRVGGLNAVKNLALAVGQIGKDMDMANQLAASGAITGSERDAINKMLAGGGDDSDRQLAQSALSRLASSSTAGHREAASHLSRGIQSSDARNDALRADEAAKWNQLQRVGQLQALDQMHANGQLSADERDTLRDALGDKTTDPNKMAAAMRTLAQNNPELARNIASKLQTGGAAGSAEDLAARNQELGIVQKLHGFSQGERDKLAAGILGGTAVDQPELEAARQKVERHAPKFAEKLNKRLSANAADAALDREGLAQQLNRGNIDPDEHENIEKALNADNSAVQNAVQAGLQKIEGKDASLAQNLRNRIAGAAQAAATVRDLAQLGAARLPSQESAALRGAIVGDRSVDPLDLSQGLRSLKSADPSLHDSIASRLIPNSANGVPISNADALAGRANAQSALQGDHALANKVAPQLGAGETAVHNALNNRADEDEVRQAVAAVSSLPDAAARANLMAGISDAARRQQAIQQGNVAEARANLADNLGLIADQQTGFNSAEQRDIASALMGNASPGQLASAVSAVSSHRLPSADMRGPLMSALEIGGRAAESAAAALPARAEMPVHSVTPNPEFVNQASRIADSLGGLHGLGIADGARESVANVMSGSASAVDAQAFGAVSRELQSRAAGASSLVGASGLSGGDQSLVSDLLQGRGSPADFPTAQSLVSGVSDAQVREGLQNGLTAASLHDQMQQGQLAAAPIKHLNDAIDSASASFVNSANSMAQISSESGPFSSANGFSVAERQSLLNAMGPGASAIDINNARASIDRGTVGGMLTPGEGDAYKRAISQANYGSPAGTSMSRAGALVHNASALLGHSVPQAEMENLYRGLAGDNSHSKQNSDLLDRMHQLGALSAADHAACTSQLTMAAGHQAAVANALASGSVPYSAQQCDAIRNAAVNAGPMHEACIALSDARSAAAGDPGKLADIDALEQATFACNSAYQEAGNNIALQALSGSGNMGLSQVGAARAALQGVPIQSRFSAAHGVAVSLQEDGIASLLSAVDIPSAPPSAGSGGGYYGVSSNAAGSVGAVRSVSAGGSISRSGSAAMSTAGGSTTAGASADAPWVVSPDPSGSGDCAAPIMRMVASMKHGDIACRKSGDNNTRVIIRDDGSYAGLHHARQHGQEAQAVEMLTLSFASDCMADDSARGAAAADAKAAGYIAPHKDDSNFREKSATWNRVVSQIAWDRAQNYLNGGTPEGQFGQYLQSNYGPMTPERLGVMMHRLLDTESPASYFNSQYDSSSSKCAAAGLPICDAYMAAAAHVSDRLPSAQMRSQIVAIADYGAAVSASSYAPPMVADAMIGGVVGHMPQEIARACIALSSEGLRPDPILVEDVVALTREGMRPELATKAVVACADNMNGSSNYTVGGDHVSRPHSVISEMVRAKFSQQDLTDGNVMRTVLNILERPRGDMHLGDAAVAAKVLGSNFTVADVSVVSAMIRMNWKPSEIRKPDIAIASDLLARGYSPTKEAIQNVLLSPARGYGVPPQRRP